MRASICIAAHDKPEYLDRVLESIFRQNAPDIEVIVSDDRGIGIRDVCEKYPVEYIRLDGEPGYRGPAKARNAAYRRARGDVIIAQSDDTVHVTDDCIEQLIAALRPGHFVIATVVNVDFDGNPVPLNRDNPEYGDFTVFTGRANARPLFFLGSLYRHDLYAVGGNDEDFVAPSCEDNWFADCLMRGRGLKAIFTDRIVGHHLHHKHLATSEGSASSFRLIAEKRDKANAGEIPWCSSGGSWNRIPKVMSFFWDGGKMSWLRYKTLESFRRWNPDWTMRLYLPSIDCARKAWTSREVDDVGYDGEDYLPKVDALGVERATWTPPKDCLSPAHASDLFQWELLSTTGGWYSDMDILYVASMDGVHDLLHDKADAVFCMEWGAVAIGLLASVPGCPVFRRIREQALESHVDNVYQCAGSESIYRLTGVWPKTHGSNASEAVLDALSEMCPGTSIANLPSEAAYPRGWWDCSRLFDHVDVIPSECLGIHWFGGNPESQKRNREWTHERHDDCTLTRAMA
ncbi:MAG: glycosyltransferase [Clostridia bacterium]